MPRNLPPIRMIFKGDSSSKAIGGRVIRFSGATVANTAGELVVTVSGGGGGSSDHATLSHLAWTSSAHTGTASRFAVFNGSGAAAELAYPSTGIVAWSGSTWSGVTVDPPLSFSSGHLSVDLSGYVPTSRTVNGHALSSDVTVTKSDVGLGSVENTALSTWAGTTNIITVGTVTTGTWHGTTLAIAYGGTGATTKSTAFDALSPMSTLGDIVHGGTSGTGTRLAGNTTTTRKFLRQTGDGTNSAAPAWDTVTKSDVGLGNVENTALSTWAGTTNIITVGTITTGAWNGTAIPVLYGGTGATSASGARTNLGVTIGTDVQAYDADLAAIAALSSTGFPARTASDIWALRSLTAPAAGITITNKDGVSGNPTFALANDLSALEGLSSTGIAVRSGTDTWVQRSVAGGSGIIVTNGDGVSGNPTIAATPNTDSSVNAAAYMWFQIRTTGGSFQGVGIGVTTSGAGTNSITHGNTHTFPDAVFSATGSGSLAVVRTTDQSYSLDQAATHQGAILTGSSLTSIRYWFGLSTNIGTASKPAGATAAIVYDPGIDVSNWQLIVWDGASASASYTVIAACATSKRYELELVTASGSVSARVRECGGTWSSTVTASSNLPGNSTKMYHVGLQLNRTAAGASATPAFCGSSCSAAFVVGA